MTTVNHLVAGSNPASGAIHTKTPKTSTFNHLELGILFFKKTY